MTTPLTRDERPDCIDALCTGKVPEGWDSDYCMACHKYGPLSGPILGRYARKDEVVRFTHLIQGRFLRWVFRKLRAIE